MHLAKQSYNQLEDGDKWFSYYVMHKERGEKCERKHKEHEEEIWENNYPFSRNSKLQKKEKEEEIIIDNISRYYNIYN